jgi:putative tricarboxylic transport membrane protein
MGRADRVSGFFWFFFSLFGSYQSYKLGLGTLHHPGPGFLFFWTGIVVAILSLIIILRSLRTRASEEANQTGFGKWHLRKAIFVLIALFLYVGLLEWLGFLAGTFFLFLFLLGFIEKKRWRFALPVSFFVTASAYLVFEVALQSRLPGGILAFLRF